MNAEQILKNIIEILCKQEVVEKLVRDGLVISSATSFSEDLVLDSLQALAFLGEVEDYFSVVIPTEMLISIESVGDVVQLILALLRKKQEAAECVRSFERLALKR